MLKWFCIICCLLFPIISVILKINKHVKHKEQYSLEYRYIHIQKFIKKLAKIEKKKIDCKGYELINKPHGGRIYIANHQSMDDICTMIQLSKKPLRFISKIENKHSFVLGKAAQSIDAFFIDRNDVRQSLRVLKEAAKATLNGQDIFLFPEGTRSKDGEVLEFKSALTNLVSMAKAEVVIIALDNTTQSFKKTKYKPFVVKVKVCEPISYQTFLEHKNDFTDYTRNILINELNKLRSEG